MSYESTTIAKVINRLNRNYFLPAIQRPFVWKPEQLIRLFDSLMKGYPISSFLFWELKPENKSQWEIYKFIEDFKYGDIHNEIAETDGFDVTLVLDGQQRLTSLMLGLRGSYTIKAKGKRWNNPDAWSKHHLYIDLLKDPNVEDDETGIEISYGFKFFSVPPQNSKDHFWIKVCRVLEFDDEVLFDEIKDELEVHFSSKDHVYQKLLKKFPDKKEKIHEILMPTPIDGKFGPSVSKSLMNILLPIANNPSLIKQIVSYLREERKLYNKEKFDLVINDGDMGSNILANNRNIPSLFVTNQFRPKLYNSRTYLYPSLIFIAKQINKATKILVADSPPPYTMCEYNLNFIKEAEHKVVYVGHFTNSKKIKNQTETDLEKLVKNNNLDTNLLLSATFNF